MLPYYLADVQVRERQQHLRREAAVVRLARQLRRAVRNPGAQTGPPNSAPTSQPPEPGPDFTLAA